MEVKGLEFPDPGLLPSLLWIVAGAVVKTRLLNAV